MSHRKDLSIFLKFPRPPPREDAKAFITQAFPRVDVDPTVLVEVGA